MHSKKIYTAKSSHFLTTINKDNDGLSYMDSAMSFSTMSSNPLIVDIIEILSYLIQGFVRVGTTGAIAPVNFSEKPIVPVNFPKIFKKKRRSD